MNDNNNNKFNDKKLNGQFYTIVNPFHNQLFLHWFNQIPNKEKETILEPFAGANNIVKMVNEFYKNNWACYDIEPNEDENKMERFQIQQNDSFKKFPKGFKVVVTNPPYLAKNSATRDKLEFPATEYDDLYKFSLSLMLENAEYVSAIIPESFITQGIFHNRLQGVATLNCRMFDDTECPVCLAVFVPEEKKRASGLNDDFHYYKGNVDMGLFSTMQAKKEFYEKSGTKANWKFNSPTGEIGLYAIDNTTTKSIRFVAGEEIPEEKVKESSRGITRISGIPEGLDTKELIKEANLVLDKFRTETSDIFLTSFRGLRKDGDYRRRLDFTLAKTVLNHSISKIGGSNG